MTPSISISAPVKPVPTITTFFPPTALFTLAAVFGDSPFVQPPPTITTPAGVTPLNASDYATPETAQLVATILGGTVVSVPPNQGVSQPTLMVLLPNNGLVNPADLAGALGSGSLSGNISAYETFLEQQCKLAGYAVNIVLTVQSAPPAAPVFVDKAFSSIYGPAYEFGDDVVPGPKVGYVIPSTPVQQDSGKICNVVNGMSFTHPVTGEQLTAHVEQNRLIQDWLGFWLID